MKIQKEVKTIDSCTLENLPDIINAQELQAFLRMSKAGIYNLLHSKDFPTLVIGSRRMVMKQDFIIWLNDHKNVHS